MWKVVFEKSIYRAGGSGTQLGLSEKLFLGVKCEKGIKLTFAQTF